MDRELCKAFRDAGFFDAFIEGKLQRKFNGGWQDVISLPVLCDVESYRIRPEKMPHYFKSAIKAIDEHGTKLRSTETNTEYDIVGLEEGFILIAYKTGYKIRLTWHETLEFCFLDGTPFYREV